LTVAGLSLIPSSLKSSPDTLELTAEV